MKVIDRLCGNNLMAINKLEQIDLDRLHIPWLIFSKVKHNSASVNLVAAIDLCNS